MIMMTRDSTRHNIVFKVSPSDMHVYAKIEKMMVPSEKPTILSGQMFPSKYS